MFLERFRNVVQAIVNKKSQKNRPKGVLFNFQDLCGEGGLDAEQDLLCGSPKYHSILVDLGNPGQGTRDQIFRSGEPGTTRDRS